MRPNGATDMRADSPTLTAGELAAIERAVPASAVAGERFHHPAHAAEWQAGRDHTWLAFALGLRECFMEGRTSRADLPPSAVRVIIPSGPGAPHPRRYPGYGATSDQNTSTSKSPVDGSGSP